MSTLPPDIRVLVVDDDPLVRSSLCLMLGGQSDLRVVGEARDGVEAVQRTLDLRPDVILMDIRMPRRSGVEATRIIHALPDPPRVLVLTTFATDEHVVSALAAGADGYLLKDTAPEQIVDAVRRVADGEAMLSPGATRQVLDQLREDRPHDRRETARARLRGLTDRERDVALSVGRGLTNAEVARALHLSVPTVKSHVSRVFEKLGTTNRVQVAMLVHDAGLR